MNPTPTADGEHISEDELRDLADTHGGHLEPKVAAGGKAGALGIVLVFVAHRFFGVEIPPEVAAAIVLLLGGGAAYQR